jgi:hypothetical protein
MLPGERDLPVGDRSEEEPPRRRRPELPSEALKRWLRIIGRPEPEITPQMRRPDPTPFEERLERIWTADTTEPGQDG